MVITVCDLLEKFECAGKFTLCGNNVTRKYWLIADRPNEAKKSCQKNLGFNVQFATGEDVPFILHYTIRSLCTRHFISENAVHFAQRQRVIRYVALLNEK